MKKVWTILLGLALAVWATPAVSSQSAVVTLLHVNDTHSHLEAAGPRTATLEGTVGGIARAATLIGKERMADPNALFLHAGDALVSDPSFNAYFGVPELELLALLGVDAFTLGNHEFDFTSTVLGDLILPQAKAFAHVPLLGANIENLQAVPSLAARITPWIVKDVNGVKVGIFGLTVPDVPMSQPAPLVVNPDVATVAKGAVAALATAGAEVVICLSHLGVLGDEALVQGVAGIDLVVGGHDHYSFPQPLQRKGPGGKAVLILQAGSHWEQLGRLRFTVTDGALKVVDYVLLPLDSRVPADPMVTAAVEQLRPGMVARWGDLFATRLGTAVEPLERTWDAGTFRRDTSLGNLIADAFRRATGAEIAVTPLGMVSGRIAAGPINGLDVFRAVGYGYDEATGLGFRLVTCDMTGGALLTALEVGVSQAEYSDSLFPQTSGLSFSFVSTRTPMQRIVPWTVFVNGRPLQPAKVYRVAMNEGVAYLLGSMGIPLTNVTVLPTAFEYTVLRDEVLRQGTVRSLSWGRIRDLATGVPALDAHSMAGEEASR